MQELKADKDLNELSIDCLANINRVLPAGYQQLTYMFGSTFDKLRDTGAFKKFFKVAAKYAYSLSKLLNACPVYSLHPLRGGMKFIVCDHNCIFFHGTSLENYEKILKSGYLKLSDYTKIKNECEVGSVFFDFFSLEKGYVFVSDDFNVSARYAVKHSTKGVVLCFDLFGLFLEHLHDREDREFVSKKEIPLDRLKKAYLVEVIDNQIHVNEMEVTR